MTDQEKIQSLKEGYTPDLIGLDCEEAIKLLCGTFKTNKKDLRPILTKYTIMTLTPELIEKIVREVEGE